MTLVYRKRVGDEVSAIYEWYESQRQGLGEEFIADFDAVVAMIVEFPQSFTRVNEKVRRANFKRFPYSVFYQVESKRIVVLSVIHQSRDSHIWPLPRKRTR
ncbi:MAG: type II toxin-antitoxin system RelE/ParE family toxin [Polyangiaceae bacterium]|nr:type II toxin-antitoxin system RelE/ParE family toxin [Polyangiaceae bacterium]